MILVDELFHLFYFFPLIQICQSDFIFEDLDFLVFIIDNTFIFT
jgi:hypothetical protein